MEHLPGIHTCFSSRVVDFYTILNHPNKSHKQAFPDLYQLHGMIPIRNEWFIPVGEHFPFVRKSSVRSKECVDLDKKHTRNHRVYSSTRDLRPFCIRRTKLSNRVGG